MSQNNSPNKQHPNFPYQQNQLRTNMYGADRVTMKSLFSVSIALLVFSASSIVANAQTKGTPQPAKTATKPATGQAVPSVQTRIGTDMQDVENALNFLGITSFKFPLAAGAGKAYAVNFIVEEYEDGKQKQQINLANLLAGQLREGDNILNYLDRVVNSTQLIRVYAQQNQPNKFAFRFGLNGFMKTSAFIEDTMVYGPSVNYPMNSPRFEVNKLTPLVIHVAQKKGKTLPDAMNMPLEEIVKNYSHTIVVYAQPLLISPPADAKPAQPAKGTAPQSVPSTPRKAPKG
jgi:hypothetical protein